MTTAERSIGRLATKRSRLVRRGRRSVPGVINTGLEVWGGWYKCTAEIAGTHWLQRGLGSSAVKALEQADKTLPSNLDNIKLEDLHGIADSARQNAEQVQTTIDDQQIDIVLVTQARRGLAGLVKAMTGVRDEFANNLAKLTSIDDRKSEVERHLAREHKKLTETDDTEMQREI